MTRMKPLGGLTVIGPRTGGGMSYATTTLECKGKSYEVSTGNSSGSCTVTKNGAAGGPVVCVDGNGAPVRNDALASCATGCGSTYGSGSCKQVAK